MANAQHTMSITAQTVLTVRALRYVSSRSTTSSTTGSFTRGMRSVGRRNSSRGSVMTAGYPYVYRVETRSTW